MSDNRQYDVDVTWLHDTFLNDIIYRRVWMNNNKRQCENCLILVILRILYRRTNVDLTAKSSIRFPCQAASIDYSQNSYISICIPSILDFEFPAITFIPHRYSLSSVIWLSNYAVERTYQFFPSKNRSVTELNCEFILLFVVFSKYYLGKQKIFLQYTKS